MLKLVTKELKLTIFIVQNPINMKCSIFYVHLKNCPVCEYYAKVSSTSAVLENLPQFQDSIFKKHKTVLLHLIIMLL